MAACKSTTDRNTPERSSSGHERTPPRRPPASEEEAHDRPTRRRVRKARADVGRDRCGHLQRGRQRLPASVVVDTKTQAASARILYFQLRKSVKS